MISSFLWLFFHLSLFKLLGVFREIYYLPSLSLDFTFRNARERHIDLSLDLDFAISVLVFAIVINIGNNIYAIPKDLLIGMAGNLSGK